MSRRKKAPQEDVNPDAWLGIYCDAVTLLLTFFILLYATSTSDTEKFDSLSKALKGHFTGEHVLGSGSTPNSNYNIIEDLVVTNEEKDELKKELENMINKNNISENVSVKSDPRGILLELKNSILFDSGSYDLKSEGVSILDEVYKLVGHLENNVVIEGHTDNIQTSSSDISNWELSTFRATSVLRYFVEQKGMNPVLFSANGYGEYKPIAENDTEENRAKNRRVEILITTQGEGNNSEEY